MLRGPDVWCLPMSIAPAPALAPAEPLAEATLDRELRLGLAAFLAGMTVLHVVRPEPFEQMVPAWLPGNRAAWHAVATVAEGTSAALLVRSGTRQAGAYLAAATMAGVYVANVEAVRRGGYAMFPGWFGTRTAAILRLPLQVPLIGWALRVARGAGHR